MSEKNSKVKILISYHKPAVLLKDDVLTPIHVGRALATEASKDGGISQEDYQWMLDNMIGDDTGDNISHLNREFCELTAIYWAWKNYDKLGNPDYIGFMHYRRHLIINKTINDRKFDTVYFNRIDDNYIDNFLIKENNIEKIIDSNDIITAHPVSVDKNVYDQFEDITIPPFNLNKDIYDNVLNYIRKEYPNYKNALEKYLKSYEHYWFNCFILKKELFFEFCSLVFSILLNIYKNIDLTNETINGIRVLAYISERIYGIFITYILDKNINIKMKYLQLSTIRNTDIQIDLYPKKNEAVHICTSCNNKYLPYLSVTIQSLIDNSNKDNFYEIYILETNISKENKQKLLSMISENIYIKFINIQNYISDINIDIFPTHSHFSIETYYRFFLPNIFKNFDKILYLDSDLIILDDIAKLVNIKVNKLLSVANDIMIMMELYNNTEIIYENKYINFKDYLNNILKLKNSTNYFQAGVALYNIKKCLEFNFKEKCLENIKRFNQLITVDQDILNIICENNVDFIDLSWNVEWNLYFKDNKESVLPANIYKKYISAYNNPKILHYCSSIKPWYNPRRNKAYIWWEYARKTPFYEHILLEMNINDTIVRINQHHNINRHFNIADIVLSITDYNNYIKISILFIKIILKKKILVNTNIYENNLDKLFSIYINKQYKRITILGIKIILKNHS